MKWTNAIPTESGRLYWQREIACAYITKQIVRVTLNGKHMMAHGQRIRHDPNIQWSNEPISEPEE